MFKPLLRSILYRYFLATSVRKNVHYSSDLQVRRGTYIAAPSHLRIGSRVSIGAYCFIACNGHIGDGVLISSYVGIVGRRDHDMHAVGTFISEAPWIYDQAIDKDDPEYKVDIGDDVWVGYGATILSGVTIGRGAVIGVRALVTNDVPPYAIMVGSPARQIGLRFEGERVALHEKLLQESRER